MKKLLLVALLSLMLALACSAVGCGAEVDAEPIALNVETEARIDIERGYALFSFTPAETGLYCFTSYSEGDTVATVYDSNMDQLAWDDDSSAEGYNFSLSCKLNAGQTYYFGAGLYDDDVTGAFPVKLIKRAGLCITPTNNTIRMWDYGEYRTLSVELLRDDGTAAFQWYSVDGDQATAIQGQTESEYTIPYVTEDADYKCVVTQDGITEECCFRIKLIKDFNAYADDESEFTLQPNTLPDEPIVFKVVVDTASGEPSYQWYEVVGDEKQIIEGAVGATYTPDANALDGSSSHYYTCEVSCMVYEDELETKDVNFSLLVQNHLKARAVNANPGRLVFTPGKPLTLSVNATCDAGAETLTYRWEKSIRVASDHYEIEPCENGDQAAYTIEGMNEEWAEYICRTYDGYGNCASVEFVVTCNSQSDGDTLTAEALNGKTYLTADEDGAATMTVEAATISAGVITYQWYQKKDGLEDYKTRFVRISGANGASFLAHGVAGEQKYACVVSDGISSKQVTFTVENDDYQGFELHAVPGTDTILVDAGSDLTLSVTAEPDVNVRYYWYKQTDSCDMLIATGDTLVLSSIQNGATYFCRATNGCSSMRQVFEVAVNGSQLNTSSKIYLATATPEEIEQSNENNIDIKPENAESNDVVMQVIAEGEDLTYQWYRRIYHSLYDSDGYNYFILLPDENGPTLTVENVEEERYYECRVSRGNLTRHEEFSIRMDSGLNVTKYVNGKESDGEEIYVKVHSDVTLNVEATTDHGPLSYNWTCYDDNTDDPIDVENRKSNTVTLTDFSGIAECNCRVKDQYNTKYVYFEINADNELSIEQEPYEQEHLFGDNVTLKVNVTCLDDSQLSFQWYQYKPEQGWEERTAIEGATGDTLELENIQEDMYYVFWVHDGLTMYESDYRTRVFEIRIGSGLKAWYADDESSYTVGLGERQELAVIATTQLENATITYLWQRYDYGLEDYVDIPDATGASYTVQNIWNGAEFRCIVSDGVSEKTLPFYIYVKSQLEMSIDEENSVTTVNPGETAVFVITARSLAPQEQITYQWYLIPFNGQTGEWDYEHRVELEGETGATLTIENARQSARYECHVTDGYEMMYTTIDLTIRNDDDSYTWFDTHRYYYIPEGGSVVIKICECDGPVDPHIYRWYRNGELIEGANGSEFTLTATKPGRLSWVVQDEYGNIQMRDAEYCTGAPVPIAEGEDETVAISESNRVRIFAFTPQTTGMYTFTISESDDYNTLPIMFNEQNTAENSYYSGESFLLSAGRTYYTAVYVTWWEEDADEYTFTIEQQEDDYEELDPVSLTLPYSPGTPFALPCPVYGDTPGDGSYDVPLVEHEDCSTNNPNILRLDWGYDAPHVFPRGAGSADVTVRYENETKRTFHITVIDAPVIEVPAMLDAIEESAFEGDTAVRIVKIGNYVSDIGEYAFRNSGIQVFWIYSDGAQIAGNAFDGASPTMIIPYDADDLRHYATNHGIPFVFMN